MPATAPGKAGRRRRFTMPGPGDRGGVPACRGNAADVADQQCPGQNRVDLFDGQSIPQGRWVMPGEAAYAI